MSGGQHGKAYQAALRCRECGQVDHIWRKCNRAKAKGHVKHMYCWRCGEVTAHEEIGGDWWNSR